MTPFFNNMGIPRATTRAGWVWFWACLSPGQIAIQGPKPELGPKLNWTKQTRARPKFVYVQSSPISILKDIMPLWCPKMLGTRHRSKKDMDFTHKSEISDMDTVTTWTLSVMWLEWWIKLGENGQNFLFYLFFLLPIV